MNQFRILSINPGSTSTKIAVYVGEKPVLVKYIKHSADELKGFKKIADQYGFRKKIVLQELLNAEIDVDRLHAVVGIGGLVKPIESGVYEVNYRMIEDLKMGVMGEHASNLGGLIASDIAGGISNCRAFIADPVVVDELQDVARISGHPKFKRLSIFHALNQKAIARSHAESIDSAYEDLNFIVAHLGGGISVGGHRKGKVIDVNNALDGEGPFSPERSGTLPVGCLARLCFSGEYTLEEVKKMITGSGGMVAYFGTNNAYEIELRAKAGDKEAILIQDAMSYQIAKEIGSMATVLLGQVDAILLTGGIAHNPMLVDYIKKMVEFISPVVVYPGEDEMKALSINGLNALSGKVVCKVYK